MEAGNITAPDIKTGYLPVILLLCLMIFNITTTPPPPQPHTHLSLSQHIALPGLAWPGLPMDHPFLALALTLVANGAFVRGKADGSNKTCRPVCYFPMLCALNGQASPPPPALPYFCSSEYITVR